MPRWFTCSQGHRWTVVETDAMDVPGESATCPHCGEPGQDLQGSRREAEGLPLLSPVSSPTLRIEATQRPLDSSHPENGDEASRRTGDCSVLTTQGRATAGPGHLGGQQTRRTVSGEAMNEEESNPETPDYPVLPGYEILEFIGEGGMGAVYKARQLAVNRIVAVKMLRSALPSSESHRKRFHSEAQAVARLQHPGIVQVFEVGEAQVSSGSPVPFFSLEYCSGGSLEDKLDGTPMEAREAAYLIETLAWTIHAAHEAGLIHRDLKPGNILLTKAGSLSELAPPRTSVNPHLLGGWVPKVADFGLARIMDADQGQTRTGAIVGSPCYMAPEQAGGDSKNVKATADVYALGVILYECLTGRPPFKCPTILGTLHQVRTQEPVSPHRLVRSVPLDLDTITLKCLEKDPDRRYPTALALAEDLHAFLAGENIRARPLSTFERGVKWARRRPAVAALAGLLFLAGLLLLGGGLMYHFRLDAQRQRAEKNFRMALRSVDEMLMEVAEEDLALQSGMDEKRRALLEKALAFYQEMQRENKDVPLLRERMAIAHRKIGDIQRLLGRLEQARVTYTEGVHRLQALEPTVSDNPDLIHEMAECYNGLGEVHRLASRPKEATEAYHQAIQLQHTLREHHPKVSIYSQDLARSHDNLGILAKDQNDLRQAQEEFRQATQLLEALVDEHPGEPGLIHLLARTLSNQGEVLYQLEGFEAAEKAYRRGLQLRDALVKEHPKERKYLYERAVCRANLGYHLSRQQDRQDEAQQCLNEAQNTLRDLVARYPGVLAYRTDMVNTSNNLAIVLAQRGQLQQAQRCWQDARDQWEKLIQQQPGVASYHGDLGMTLSNLGRVAKLQKAYDQARPLLQRSLKELITALWKYPDHKDYRRAFRNGCQDLAVVLVRLKEHEAIRVQATALTRELPQNHLGTYRAVCFLARSVRELQRQPPHTQANEHIQQHTQLALRLLHDTGNTPPKVLRGLLVDKDFEPFRRQQQFISLLASRAR